MNRQKKGAISFWILASGFALSALFGKHYYWFSPYILLGFFAICLWFANFSLKKGNQTK